ncbi:hypothetical protein EHS25_005992 [Saitozyma podzolica]|uniref:Solute carrier family 25 member 38 homolog n=1 Tax=Saitozyma podzolica TaxID=1890683 RepID=A0A427XTR6_9TREE|nr:hypothetical protein EHS25_005992 [Saitozyma podzolica]
MPTSTPVSGPTRPVAVTSNKDLRATHHLASGALSGLTSAIILQPLDLLKTRLQQSYEGESRKRNVPGVAMYFYALSAIRGELSQIPYFAVSQSSPSPSPSRSSAAIPPSASSSSSASTILSSPSPASSSKSRTSHTALVKLSSQGNLLAGAIARTSVGFVLNPITVVKARYESSRYSEYHSVLSALRSLVRNNGVRGLFQGFTATAARDAPYAGLYLVFYEKLKELSTRLVRPEWGVPYAAQHSGSGALAAVMATLVTSPADCVKTRMQVNPTDHPTLRKAVMRIYLDRGLAGFFSGSSLRISRKAASSAIGWTVYEGLLLFLRDR